MKTKRIFLSLALFAVCVLSISCKNQLVVQGLPGSCVKAKVEMRISQEGRQKIAGTAIVTPKGEAIFKLGASTQSQSQLRSGHRPSTPEVNAIYTADPVIIELRSKDPCKEETKKLTVVLDDLTPGKVTGGRVEYVVKFDQFKP